MPENSLQAKYIINQEKIILQYYFSSFIHQIVHWYNYSILVQYDVTRWNSLKIKKKSLHLSIMVIIAKHSIAIQKYHIIIINKNV